MSGEGHAAAACPGRSKVTHLMQVPSFGKVGVVSMERRGTGGRESWRELVVFSGGKTNLPGGAAGRTDPLVAPTTSNAPLTPPIPTRKRWIVTVGLGRYSNTIVEEEDRRQKANREAGQLVIRDTHPTTEEKNRPSSKQLL